MYVSVHHAYIALSVFYLCVYLLCLYLRYRLMITATTKTVYSRIIWAYSTYKTANNALLCFVYPYGFYAYIAIFILCV